MPNVDSIRSVSSDGLSVIILQFTDGIDLDMASLDVREKVDMLSPVSRRKPATPR